MLDRARWTGKLEEAEIYRRWIVGKLSKPLVDNFKPMAIDAGKGAVEQIENQFENANDNVKIAA